MRVGRARKNEYSVATFRSNPTKSPPMIVEPDRDIPGSNEAHWATPIQKADFRLTCSSWLTVARSRRASTARIIRPPTMEEAATVCGVKRWLLIQLWVRNPIAAAGKKE